jgi:thiamine kinase-like enzyme
MARRKIYDCIKKNLMFDKKNFLSQRSLTVLRLLQTTNSKTVELLINEKNERFVLKTIHKISKATEIEKQFLIKTTGLKFRVLSLPQLLEYGENFLLMTFVDREHHTRNTIINREWIDSDVERFVNGLIEFQTLSINLSPWFDFKKRFMSVVYPVIKTLLSIKTGLQQNTFSFIEIIKIFQMCFIYLLFRVTFKNVITHYDLTTYNYSFSGKDKMSMIDFELGYPKGDPVFDIIYFISIPPVLITNWTFQKKILINYMHKQNINYALKNRIRFILMLCNLRRCFFYNDNEKRAICIENFQRLLHQNIDKILDQKPI